MTTTTRTYPEVPEKMSELIRLAVTDGRALDRELYTPHCLSWHSPTDFFSANGNQGKVDTICEICLAGAVIAGTLGADPKNRWLVADMLDGDDRERGWYWALSALDEIRKGNYTIAASRLGLVPKDATEAGELIQRLLILENNHNNASFAFYDWRRFDRHLASLEELAPKLESLGL